MSKEKTREIKGWIREYHAPWIKEGVAMPFFPEKPTDGGPLIEATLLIKEPEKTVTISESQFAQMAREIEHERKRSEKLIEALEIIGILPTSDELKTSKDCEEYYISVAKQALKEYRGEK